MAETHWTPGPWRVQEEWGANNELCFHSIRSALHNNYIASTWAGPNGPTARLISAAPDLYACLAKIVAMEEGRDDDWMEAAEAALAKARGETS